jgi:hypothetical protein
MLDTNLFIMIVVVAVAGVLVYIVERHTKKKQVEWMDAAKIGLLSGAGAGGLLYAVGGDVETVVTSTVATASSAVQDMFVGKPSF